MATTYPGWLKGFPKGFKDGVMQAIAATDHSRVVAVDADGTLWKNDLGEHFLQWLCGLIEGGPEEPILPPTVWKDYQKILKKDRALAYGFAVQCMAGIEFADLLTWMDYVAATWKFYKPRMAALLNGLRDEGNMQVYIVSASNAWIIRRAMLYMDVEADGVFGIETEMDDVPGTGLVLTDRLVQPVTCMAGKVEVLQKHVKLPVLAIGNSVDDLPMLDAARVRLVVGHTDQGDNEMMKLAIQRGWHHIHF